MSELLAATTESPSEISQAIELYKAGSDNQAHELAMRIAIAEDDPLTRLPALSVLGAIYRKHKMNDELLVLQDTQSEYLELDEIEEVGLTAMRIGQLYQRFGKPKLDLAVSAFREADSWVGFAYHQKRAEIFEDKGMLLEDADRLTLAKINDKSVIARLMVSELTNTPHEVFIQEPLTARIWIVRENYIETRREAANEMHHAVFVPYNIPEFSDIAVNDIGTPENMSKNPVRIIHGESSDRPGTFSMSVGDRVFKLPYVEGGYLSFKDRAAIYNQSVLALSGILD